MCPEDSSAISFGELTALVIQILSSGDVMQKGPSLFGGDQAGGEDDGMEGHVILAHELEQFHVLIDPPILVVLLQQVGGDGDVPNWRIKPYIEYLFLEFLDGDSDTPFQIPGDALGFQSHIGPCLGDGD